MIIHSTTLDTAAKVKAQYGGTTWISHSGYVLRGATSGVTSNSATKTGGNDNAIIPYHNHTTNNHSHTFSVVKSGTALNGSTATQFNPLMLQAGSSTSSTAEANVTVNYAGTNGNTVNANIPNYKSVYIWERTA